jgi:hypothetical protein
MRKFQVTLLTTVLLVFTSCARSQERANISQSFCSFNATELSSNKVTDSPPDQKMVEIIKEILVYTGLQQNFEVKAYDRFNTEAKVIDKQRYIFYNPQFLGSIRESEKSNWAAIGIIAHEMAHHLLGHTVEHNATDKELELEADRFAGFVMYRRGANLEQARIGFNAAITNAKPNGIQLSREERIKAVEDGWDEAQALSSLTNQSSISQRQGESKHWANVRNATLKAAVYQRFTQNFRNNQKVAYEAAQEYLKLNTDDKDAYAQYLKKWIAAYEARQK